MVKNLIIVQTTVANYRTPVFKMLESVLKNKFQVYCGGRFFDPTIKLDDSYHPDLLLNNHFLLSDKFLWQSGLLSNAFKDGVMVLSMNPRVLSNWAVLILRRLSKKPVFLWGHAWPKEGKDAKSDKLRHLMRLLSNEIIVYTNNHKSELQLKMPTKKIRIAPNALYFKEKMIPVHTSNPNDIIYVSRMVENKKVDLLYTAFKASMVNLPQESRLILIGDGPERALILRRIEQDNLHDRVIIPGSINDINELYEYYKSSLISVSPGRVGLSLTQSLGFGVPMIIARRELHGPEIEAAQGNNAYFFTENDAKDLANKITSCFENRTQILQNRKGISEFCKSNYSIEAMVDAFVNIIED